MRRQTGGATIMKGKRRGIRTASWAEYKGLQNKYGKKTAIQKGGNWGYASKVRALRGKNLKNFSFIAMLEGLLGDDSTALVNQAHSQSAPQAFRGKEPREKRGIET